MAVEAHTVRLGLEFIGPTTMRRQRRFDFIHTLDGVRALIAAAHAQNCVGLKLDAFHWYTSGAGLLDIEKLSAEEVVYVEVNDGRLTIEIGKPGHTTNTCLVWCVIEPSDE